MCAQISIKYKVSVEIARLAVKIVLKSLYNHDVYLSIKGKKEIKSGIYTANRVPVSKADYEEYFDILPSAKTVTD